VSPQGLGVQPVPGPDLGEHPAARVARPALSPTSRPTVLGGSAREQVPRWERRSREQEHVSSAACESPSEIL